MSCSLCADDEIGIRYSCVTHQTRCVSMTAKLWITACNHPKNTTSESRLLREIDAQRHRQDMYRMTCKCSHAHQVLEVCSIVISRPMRGQKAALQAPFVHTRITLHFTLLLGNTFGNETVWGVCAHTAHEGAILILQRSTNSYWMRRR